MDIFCKKKQETKKTTPNKEKEEKRKGFFTINGTKNTQQLNNYKLISYFEIYY